MIIYNNHNINSNNNSGNGGNNESTTNITSFQYPIQIILSPNIRNSSSFYLDVELTNSYEIIFDIVGPFTILPIPLPPPQQQESEESSGLLTGLGTKTKLLSAMKTETANRDENINNSSFNLINQKSHYNDSTWKSLATFK
nr:4860_t:CDS:2 [Entrophospora candida]